MIKGALPSCRTLPSPSHLPELDHHSLMKPTAALSVHAGQQHPKNTAGNKHVESIALTICLYLIGKGTVQLLSGGITPCKVQLKTENTLLPVLEICRCYTASQNLSGDLKRITQTPWLSSHWVIPFCQLTDLLQLTVDTTFSWQWNTGQRDLHYTSAAILQRQMTQSQNINMHFLL